MDIEMMKIQNYELYAMPKAFDEWFVKTYKSPNECDAYTKVKIFLGWRNGWEARAAMIQQPKCPACNGNDADRPCAYPCEHEAKKGCLRNARFSQQPKAEESPVDVAALGRIDGMGNKHPDGSYVSLSVGGIKYRISEGAAEVLANELLGSLGNNISPTNAQSGVDEINENALDKALEHSALISHVSEVRYFLKEYLRESNLHPLPDDEMSKKITTKKNIEEEICGTIYDCCHSLSQPSMRGLSWGQIKDYLQEQIKIAMKNNKYLRLYDSLTIADYEEVLKDHRRLVRELDIALNGDGAAQQASLCDIVAQVKANKRFTIKDVERAYDAGWERNESGYMHDWNGHKNLIEGKKP